VTDRQPPHRDARALRGFNRASCRVARFFQQPVRAYGVEPGMTSGPWTAKTTTSPEGYQ
jgi:hypothetical protein